MFLLLSLFFVLSLSLFLVDMQPSFHSAGPDVKVPSLEALSMSRCLFWKA